MGSAENVRSFVGVRPAGEARLATTKLSARTALLLALLAVELVALIPPADAYFRVEASGWWGWFWVWGLHQIRPALATGILATIFLSWDALRDEFVSAANDSERWAPRSNRWLIAHLLTVASLFVAKWIKDARPPVSLEHGELWLAAWTAMSLPVFVTWAGALMPARFWTGWFGRSRAAFLAGAGFGAIADFLAGSTEAMWWPLQRLTFRVVAVMLHLCGQTVVSQPAKFTIGTPHFSVQIWQQCSGFEGMGLVAAFLAGYLWFYRKELRFPHALLLFPIGALAIWMTNAVRITALILIGGWNSDAGFKGFHSTAGWLFFNLVACGLIWASWRFNLFAKGETRHSAATNPAGVYIAPLLAIMVVSMLTAAFSPGFDFLYPLRVVAAVAVFWFYRRELLAMNWSGSLAAIALGAAVFAFWIALAHFNAAAEAATQAGLAEMSRPRAEGWLLSRIIGSVITVPLAEELAFRGYLIRKFVSYDFTSVALGRFTWFSFIGTSVLFGALHGEWLAGTLAGMVFAIALYRRGRLCDAVWAHATANGLLCAYVLATGSWWLWT